MLVYLFVTGWHITSIGCSLTSIVISADDTLIAWGASPTYGELVSFYFTFFFFILGDIYDNL